MTGSNNNLKAGAILHSVIVGCLKASGTTFDAWCRDNGVSTSAARQATYGQSGGDKGKSVLDRMIEDAGRAQVQASYRKRIERHAADMKSPQVGGVAS